MYHSIQPITREADQMQGGNVKRATIFVLYYSLDQCDLCTYQLLNESGWELSYNSWNELV